MEEEIAKNVRDFMWKILHIVCDERPPNAGFEAQGI